jgi:hypothetical protein
MKTKAAPFAGEVIDLKVFYGIKPTQLLAKAALVAFFLFDASLLPAPKLTFIHNRREKDKVEVGSVYVAVC